MMEIITIKDHFPEHFYALPDAIYKDLNFRPEEEREQIETLLKFAIKSFDLMLITDQKNVRLLGIFPPGESTAYFGFWETVDDFQACEKAFALLFSESKRRGYNRIERPVNFNTFHRYRLRLDAPSWGQFDREPVNPEYYPRYLERLGFEIHNNYESRRIHNNVVPEVYRSKIGLLENVQDLPFEFISINRDVWIKREQEIFELIHLIFCLNPGFQAIPIAEFRVQYNADFAAQLCPHSSFLLEDRDSGKLLAINLAYPNYAPLNLSEKPVFETHYPLLKHRTLLVKTNGVHPDFRKQGLMNSLGAYAMLSFRKYYDDVIYCLMRSDNPSLRFSDSFEFEKAGYASYAKYI